MKRYSKEQIERAKKFLELEAEFSAAMAAGAHRKALQVLIRQNEFLGLYPDQAVENGVRKIA